MNVFDPTDDETSIQNFEAAMAEVHASGVFADDPDPDENAASEVAYEMAERGLSLPAAMLAVQVEDIRKMRTLIDRRELSPESRLGLAATERAASAWLLRETLRLALAPELATSVVPS